MYLQKILYTKYVQEKKSPIIFQLPLQTAHHFTTP